ncbi:MAG TPA: peptidoglycan-associated lipoprotein Pal [Candidatus Acidoferrum sp.]|nr:peptidoglycan-associated lipoprotein Pal [Candidatus Acidoferrum sp.]
MRKLSFSRYALLGLLAICLVGASCNKQPVSAPSKPSTTTSTQSTPPAARPTVTLQASSTFIQKGDSVTLTWSSTNATSLVLAPSVGSVSPEGNAKVSPADSTTYTITATGPGGSVDQSVRITVGAAHVGESTTTPIVEVPFDRGVHDAFFDYNKFDLRPDAKEALSQTAQYLRQHPDIKVAISGHCDERGTTEYNLGLGQNRADETKKFLVSLGVAENRISTTSYGKEKPFCTSHDEACWQENRRAHFTRAQ